jgi:hypothetical protein
MLAQHQIFLVIIAKQGTRELEKIAVGGLGGGMSQRGEF